MAAFMQDTISLSSGPQDDRTEALASCQVHRAGAGVSVRPPCSWQYGGRGIGTSLTLR